MNWIANNRVLHHNATTAHERKESRLWFVIEDEDGLRTCHESQLKTSDYASFEGSYRECLQYIREAQSASIEA